MLTGHRRPGQPPCKRLHAQPCGRACCGASFQAHSGAARIPDRRPRALREQPCFDRCPQIRRIQPRRRPAHGACGRTALRPQGRAPDCGGLGHARRHRCIDRPAASRSQGSGRGARRTGRPDPAPPPRRRGDARRGQLGGPDRSRARLDRPRRAAAHGTPSGPPVRRPARLRAGSGRSLVRTVVARPAAPARRRVGVARCARGAGGGARHARHERRLEAQRRAAGCVARRA